MKLMVVAPYFYPKTGGLETYAYYISSGLIKNCKWEVVVITSNNEGAKNTVEYLDKLKIYRLKRWFKFSNTPMNPMWLLSIYKIIKKEQPDLLNIHTPVPFIADIAAMLARRLKIKYIVTYHSASLLNGRFIIDVVAILYQTLFENTMLKNASKIIILNTYVEQNHLSKYANKIEYVLPGVDYSTFNDTHKKINNKKNVLFVGNLSKAHQLKGLKYLLQAFEKLVRSTENAVLTIVGGGDYIEFYKNEAKRLNIHDKVIFADEVPHTEIYRYYKTSDVFVLPSYSNSESFGLVLIEAMACGVPVIGSNIGGIPNVIENGVTGLLVEPKNPIELYKAMLFVLTDENLSKKFALNSLIKVKEQYNWDKSIVKTDLILRRLL